MVHCPCLFLSLCAAHALGSTDSSLHATLRSHHDRLRQRDKGAESWTRESSKDLSRARGGLRSSSSMGLTTNRIFWGVNQRVDSLTYDRRNGGTDTNVREVIRRIARYRGGSSGGYNYDDDYYGGNAGKDPYYDDGGGWGDESPRKRRRGDRHDPYEDRREPRRGRGSRDGGFDLTGTITQGNKTYGVYALAGSVLLTMMGISLMFEKNLIRLGNIGFVIGVALFIGPSNVMRYFSQTSKLRGTIIFAIGFFFVLTGNPIIGLAVEVFGFLNLFGNMLPMLWAMASNMPLVKDVIGSGRSRRRSSGRSRSGRSPRQPPPPPPRYPEEEYNDYDWDNNGAGEWENDYYDYDHSRR